MMIPVGGVVLLYREQSGVIGEGPGGYTADRERKGRIKCQE